MRISKEKFITFLTLVGIGLAITVSLSLDIYTDENSSSVYRAMVVGGASLIAVIVAVALIITYQVGAGIWDRRRRPLVWLAIRAMDAASRKTDVPIPAHGISDRDGSLAVSLALGQNDFISLGDHILATHISTGKYLGILEVVVVEQDFCLCEVTDRMDSQEFWAGLEDRMMREFCPPYGVEFLRRINQDSIDLVKRLIRRWGEDRNVD